MDPNQEVQLSQLTPLLCRNLDLGDYDVIEQLQEDDIITASDVERYITPHADSRSKQVHALVSLVRRRPGDVFGSLQRSLEKDAPFISMDIHRSTVAQPSITTRELCLHCSILNSVHDVQDISASLYADGFIPDAVFEKLQPSVALSRTQKLRLLLQTLGDDVRRPLASKDKVTVDALRAALGKKYPKLQKRLLGHNGSDLGECSCPPSKASPLEHALRLFRGMLTPQGPHSPISPAEGGPDQQQARNVQLCIELDGIINSGSMDLYEQHVDKLMKDNPDDVDIEITVLLHNMLANTTTVRDLDRAESYVPRLTELIPLSKCSGYFEIDFLGLQAHVLKKRKTMGGVVQQRLSDGVQKAETTVPDRITGFIFSNYAKFLTHVYKTKLYTKCPKRQLDEIEAYFIAALMRFRTGAERLQSSLGAGGASSTLITDCYSRGAETMLYLAFFYLRTCMEGHMLETVLLPRDELHNAEQCLMELRKIEQDLMPERFKVNMHFAEAALKQRQAESHPDLHERSRLLGEAVHHAQQGLQLAQAGFQALVPVAHRFMNFLTQRIQYRPDALMRMEFSTTATSEFSMTSSGPEEEKLTCESCRGNDE